MTTKKRVCGNYEIETLCGGELLLNPDADQPTGSGTVRVDGDLVITGTYTSVNSQDLSVTDNVITINDGETGAGVSAPWGAGIKVDRGTEAATYLRYNDILDRWEGTDDGTTWYPLNPGFTSTFELVQDLTPQLGGDLDVNGFTISSASNGDVVIDADGTGKVKINHELSLEDQTTDPAPITGYNQLYAKAVSTGGTGLYVSNNDAQDELVSRSQALAFALIF